MRFFISLVFVCYAVVAIAPECACHAISQKSAWVLLQEVYRSSQRSRICTRFTSPTLWTHIKRNPSTRVLSKDLCDDELTNHVGVSDAFDNLKKWLVDNGATLDLHGLELKSCSISEQKCDAPTGEPAGNRGLLASRSYRRGDLLASIPANLHFTQDALNQLVQCVLEGQSKICDTSNLREAAAKVHARDPKIRLAFPLALFQVLQKEGLAPSMPAYRAGQIVANTPLARLYDGWLAYLHVLPHPPPTMPIFWTAEELRALDHPIANAVFERHHRLQSSFRDFETIARKHFSMLAPRSYGPNFRVHFERLVSAYATVLSHSVRVPGGAYVLVPLVDLCNHCPYGGNASLKLSVPRQSYGLPTELDEPLGESSLRALRSESYPSQRHAHVAGSIQLRATREISPGDEIKVSYGAFDNPTVLLNYGLLPLENPNEKISIDFSPRRVHSALRSIGVDLMMLADDFSYLGPNTVKALTRLGLAPPPGNCTMAEGSFAEYRPTVTINADSEPDARLLAAAQVLTSDEYTTSLDGQPSLNDAGAAQSSDGIAKQFVISFLKHALFEQFSTTAVEDCKLLRHRKVLTGRSHCGLEQEAVLSPAMRMAVSFRSRRRAAFRTAIDRLQQSLKAS